MKVSEKTKPWPTQNFVCCLKLQRSYRLYFLLILWEGLINLHKQHKYIFFLHYICSLQLKDLTLELFPPQKFVHRPCCYYLLRGNYESTLLSWVRANTHARNILNNKLFELTYPISGTN
jgi:hypothetical protein